jgi:L-cysteine:1D-myo-inositol 2-amino-2-deoxy-alpha-D-glucopyranoside ligase
MRAWTRPALPRLPGTGPIPRIFDSATRRLVEARPTGVASIYVCGITPYDATHLGHAATYLAYDTLIRLWLDAGLEVEYVQNSTDVDDPLLERAARDGVDWRQLAAEQTELFRGDMEHLRIIPPDHYVAVTEIVGEVADAVRLLEDAGIAYPVEGPDAAPDLYFDSSFTAPAWHLGTESNLDRASMLELSAKGGGDPKRAGKRDPLDPLLWRAERPAEPAWDSVLGRGRPGWHVECAVIALRYLPSPITVNGGGSDLLFPHHEFSAGHATALTGRPLADIYSHAGMVAHDGEKMSKSRGNLVLVSHLVADGVDPRAIRLALASEHYRSDWEWTDAHLEIAMKRLASWEAWAANTTNDPDEPFLAELRALLADDLDSPAALTAIDARIAAEAPASAVLIDAIDALLGIRLS